MGKFIDFLLARQSTPQYHREHISVGGSFEEMNQVTTVDPLKYSHIKEGIKEDAHTTQHNTKEPNINMLLHELQSLKDEIRYQKDNTYTVKGISEVKNHLKHLGVSNSLIKIFIDELESNLTIKKINNADYVNEELYSFLERKVRVYKPAKIKTKQRSITLIGASGVGKTTALFKLANFFEEEKNGTHVRLANMDNQKVAAKETFEKARSYMEIDGHSFIKVEDLLSFMRKGQRPEIMLIDTTGKNYNAQQDLEKMSSNFGEFLLKGETFLVIPVNVSEADARTMIEAFKILNYKAVILSKFDEAMYPATIIGVCIEMNIPIAYISKGGAFSDTIIEVQQKDLMEVFKK